MALKRYLSAKDSIKKKVKKLDVEDAVDYTKLLTAEDVEIIESGDEQELSIANKPEKISSAKKAQSLKKKLPKTDKDGVSKKAKGNPITTTDNKPTEKPNWNEFKKEKQELRLKRKHQKCPYYETLLKAKTLWEQLRREDCPKEKMETLLNDLFKCSKPHLKTMVYSHDSARIVQWMLKLGTPEICSQVINELIKHVPTMLLFKYACSCVNDMLKQGNAEQRNTMINSLKGKYFTLTLHSNSSKIMDLIYTTYATPEQKSIIMHDLYGASSILCESPNVLSLSDVLKNSPNTKEIILAKTKDHIRKFVFKQKTSMQTTLVHNLIYEYILYTSGKDCNELFSSLKEFPIELFFTSKSGCYLAMHIIWNSNPKEKKGILKHLKTIGATRDLATSEYGHLILLALFDGVDDTVLIKKTIIPEILSIMDELALNEYGRKVILYLVAWRNSSYFHPQVIELLKSGDLIKECKKDDNMRVKELSSAVSDCFLQHVEENPHFWLSNGSIAMVLLGVLKSGCGEKLKKPMTSVANYLVNPDNMLEEYQKKIPVYEHSGIHVVLKKIIGNDRILMENNSNVTFAEILSLAITEDTLKLWVKCNRALFLLVALVESNVQSAIHNVKKLFSPKVRKLLKEQKLSGAKILAAKLSV